MNSTEENNIVVYTDGASRGNPGNAGWGCVVASNTFVIESGAGRELATNNQMELQAIIESLKIILDAENAKNFSLKNGGTISLYTDSSYAKQGIEKWIAGWKRNGWISSKKEPVVNEDLWKELDALLQQLSLNNITLNIIHVSGHQGIDGNERVDVIASSFADMFGRMTDEKSDKKSDEKNPAPELYIGNRSDYTIDLSITDAQIDAAMKSRKKSKKKNTGKAYSYVSLVHGDISVDSDWKTCEQRVKGIKGKKGEVRFKKALSSQDEKAIIDAFKKGADV